MSNQLLRVAVVSCKNGSKSIVGQFNRSALKSAKMSSQDTEKYNMIFK